MLNHEKKDRPQSEHHQGMTVEAIAEPSPGAQCRVLSDGQSRDVADAASVEISRTRVVMSMRAAPMVIWRERQNPEEATDPVIDLTARKHNNRTKNPAAGTVRKKVIS